MKKEFLAYSGHLNMDVVMRTKKISDAITLPLDSVEENFGGTAGNFAIVAAKLGLRFRLYSIVSGKSHSKYMDFLEKLGINTDGILVTDDDFGPVCYAINDGREQKYFLAEGPMKYEKYRILEESYDYLHLGTGNPELNRFLLENTKSEKRIFDPSQEVFYKYDRSWLDYFSKNTSIFMGNENEIKFILNELKMDMKQLSSMVNIVMTAGANGAYFIENENYFHIKPFKKIENGDTLGAGDSFRSGFYYGLKESNDIIYAIKFGVAVSGMVVEHGLKNFNPNINEIKSIVNQIKHENMGKNASLQF
ncbi:PfkB family carbohydrate kinase [Caldiplasma sukawensis]